MVSVQLSLEMCIIYTDFFTVQIKNVSFSISGF